MDILVSEREKRLLRLGISILRKKLGFNASVVNIEKHLRKINDPALTEILDVIEDVCNNTTASYQRKVFKEYSHLGLYIAINHPKIKQFFNEQVKRFTKFEGVAINHKPRLSRVDIFIIDKMLNYMIKKFSERATYMAILSEAYVTTNDIGKYYVESLKQDEKKDILNGMLHSFIWLGIWIGVNDTAYRHQFYYAIHKLGNDELKELSKPFYFEPDKWYINIYTEAVKQRNELWNKNEIPHHYVTTMEEPCILEKQREKLKKHAEKFGVK